MEVRCEDLEPAAIVYPSTFAARLASIRARLAGTASIIKNCSLQATSRVCSRIPCFRSIAPSAIHIIFLLVLVNIFIWLICATVVLTRQPRLISTAAVAYTLGLRHALDADHISAIDLMTRRLIASGQRPVTVGTFFSLGHSTIVLITCIVVAATEAAVRNHFNGISVVGGIIGSSVSAAFLILLGLMNVFIFYRLLLQLRKVLRMRPEQSQADAWKIEGGGVLFKLLKKLFEIVNRPWKMYFVGLLFGLGFDTSSEVALLGISSIQAAQGTNIWLILVFPILFTNGMCLVDTIDGALMMSLYVKPMDMYGESKSDELRIEEGEPRRQLEVAAGPDRGLVAPDSPPSAAEVRSTPTATRELRTAVERAEQRAKDPIAFLYYSTVLTGLTVVVALVIGTIQLLTMIFNVSYPTGKTRNRFWKGIEAAGDNWEIIGGSICGSFIIVGIASVIAYKPWRRWAERRRDERFRVEDSAGVVDEDRESITALEVPFKNGNNIRRGGQGMTKPV